MVQKDGVGFMWNLVIFDDENKHCWLEGCFEHLKDAYRWAAKRCKGRNLVYRVYSEMEYIHFKNPYVS